MEFKRRDEGAFILLERASRSLEGHFRDMQQYEFVYSSEVCTVRTDIVRIVRTVRIVRIC
jgi:hypothetical protein